MPNLKIYAGTVTVNYRITAEDMAEAEEIFEMLLDGENVAGSREVDQNVSLEEIGAAK